MPHPLQLGAPRHVIDSPSAVGSRRAAAPPRRSMGMPAPTPARLRSSLRTQAAAGPRPARPDGFSALHMAAGSLSFQDRIGHLRTWWRSVESVPPQRIAEALGAHRLDLQLEALDALDNTFPQALWAEVLTALLVRTTAPWLRVLVAAKAYQAGFGRPLSARLHDCIVRHNQASVRAMDLLYQTPARPSLMGWLEDPSAAVRLRAALLVCRESDAPVKLSMSLLQEQAPWVIHVVLRSLCDSHPGPAWRLWGVLPPALRAAPTLAMLQRYGGEDGRGMERPTVRVSSATQAAMKLLADSFCGLQCDRCAAVEPAGQVVAELVAQGGRAELELAAAVVQQCVQVAASKPLEAALVALRPRPSMLVELALPLLQSSDYRVLEAVAAALPAIAAAPEAYPGMRFLARHRFEAVRAVACAGLPAFAKAQPEQRDDIVNILRQNSACLNADPSVVALEALWELSNALPEERIDAAATARQVVRDGGPAARGVALRMLGNTRGDLESALCLAMASQSASTSVRQAALEARASRLTLDWRDLPMGEVARQAQELAEADEAQQRLVLAEALVLHLQSAVFAETAETAEMADVGSVLQVAEVLGGLTWHEPDTAAQLDTLRLRAMPALLAAQPGGGQLLAVLIGWVARLTQVDATHVRALATCRAPGKDSVLLALVANGRIRTQTQAALGTLWGL